MNINQAPVGVVLEVDSEALRTLIKNGRGGQILRGSKIIKLNDKEVKMVEAYTWYIPVGARKIPVDGVYEISSERVYGTVKEV